MRMRTIELTGWKSGTSKSPGTCGFRVKLGDHDELFIGLEEVVLELPPCNGKVQP